MDIRAEKCVLILDGRRLGEFACAIEVSGGQGQEKYGFLSGPLEMLKAARMAKWVQIV